MFNQVETLGQTQDTHERLHLQGGRRMPQYCPREDLEEVARRREIWAFLPNLVPRDQNSDNVITMKVSGWMDGWMENIIR